MSSDKKDVLKYKVTRADLGQRYTSEPGEEFDFDAWAEGRTNCWRSGSQTVEEEKYKAHVITSPLLNVDFKVNEKQLKEYLRSKGKPVYFSPDGKSLTPIHSVRELENASKRLVPLDQKTIYPLIPEQGLTKDQTLIINHEEQNDLDLFPQKQKFESKDAFNSYNLIVFSLEYFKDKGPQIFKQTIDTQASTRPIALELGKNYRLRANYLEQIITRYNVQGLYINTEDANEDHAAILLKHKKHLKNLRVLVLKKLEDQIHWIKLLPYCSNLLKLSLSTTFSGPTQILNKSFGDNFSWTIQLEELELSGIIPPFINSLPNLKKLKLSWVNQKEFKAIDWAKFHSLEELQLDLIPFEELVYILNSCPNLRRLKLTNGVSGSSLVGLKEIKKLDCLELGGAYEAGVLPYLLSCCPGLKSLDLHVSDDKSKILWNNAKISLPALTHFKVSGNVYAHVVENVVKKILVNVPSLEVLELNQITGELSLDEAASFPRLQSLIINRCKTSGGFLKALCKDAKELTHLQLAYLPEVDIGDLNIRFKKIQRATLTGKVNNEVVNATLKESRLLRKLTINGGYDYQQWTSQPSKLSDLSLKGINHSLDSLQYLDLSYVNLDAEEFLKFLSLSPNLKVISLTGCKMTGNLEIWEKASLQFAKLKKFKVDHLNASQSFVACVINAAKYLKKIEISSGKLVGKTSITLTHCESLQDLEVDYAEMESSAFLSSLLQAPNLKHLSCGGLEVKEEGPISLAIPSLLSLTLISKVSYPLFCSLLLANPKLKYLHLNLLRVTSKETFTLPESISLNELRELEIFSYDEIINSLIQKAPNLKRLAFKMCYKTFDILMDCKPILLQLEELDVDNQLHRSILQYCPNLIKLKLDDSLFDNYDPKLPLAFPRLKELSFLRIQNVEDLDFILNAAPHLESLDLSFDRKCDIVRAAELLLAYLPNRKIKELHIEGQDLYQEAALKIKKIVPHARIIMDFHQEVDDVVANSKAREQKKSPEGKDFFAERSSDFRSAFSLDQAEFYAKYQGFFSPPKRTDFWMNQTESCLDNLVDLEGSYHVQQYFLPNRKRESTRYLLCFKYLRFASGRKRCS